MKQEKKLLISVINQTFSTEIMLIRGAILNQLKNFSSLISLMPILLHLFIFISLISTSIALPASAFNNAFSKLNPLLSTLPIGKISIKEELPSKFGTLKLCPPGKNNLNLIVD